MFSGAVTLFSRFGGVRPVESGFRRCIVEPTVVDSLKWVPVRIETVRGRTESKWQRQGKTLTPEVEIPVGAEAEVHVPAAGACEVFESGVSAGKALGVKHLAEHAQEEVYRVSSN
ncbi:MAG TPA: alpha-L-rhamnosidase C-terminal domain-containing protein [Bacteroidota bacterium]|nr:alpha-L-rhamnosidase C-terminal domain-containing protein [Bacteroidota bacterium]